MLENSLLNKKVEKGERMKLKIKVVLLLLLLDLGQTIPEGIKMEDQLLENWKTRYTGPKWKWNTREWEDSVGQITAG